MNKSIPVGKPYGEDILMTKIMGIVVQLLDVPLQSGFDSKKNLLGQPLPWNNRNLDRDTHTHTVYHMKTKKHVYTWISNTVYIYIKGWIDPR